MTLSPPITSLRMSVVAILPPLIGTATFSLFLGTLHAVSSVRLAADGGDARVTGLVLAAYSIGFLVGCFSGPPVVRGLGHRGAMLVFAAALGLLSAAHAPFDGGIAWAIPRFLVGISASGFCVAIESWINGRVPNLYRGRSLAIYQIGNWSGSGLAPVSLVIADPLVPSFFLIPTAGFALLALLTAWAPWRGRSEMAPPPRGEGLPASRSRLGFRRIIALPLPALAACVASGLINGTIYNYMPTYFHAVGFSLAQLSLFLSVAMILGTMLQFPLSMVADLVGRRLVVMVLGAAGAIASVALAALDSPGFAVTMALGMIIAASGQPMYGTGATLANERLPPEEMVGSAGALLLLWGIGATIGPLVLGGMIEAFGARAMLFYYAIVGAIVLLTAVASPSARRAG